MTIQVDETAARRELIAQLFGAFGRTPTEANYAGYEAALKLMPTPTLARVVSTWLENISEATDPIEIRVPTAGKLWDLRRKLRKLPAAPVLELKAHEPKFLAFDTNANQLLMAYLWKKHGPKNVTRYQVPAALQWLVKYKNAWAHDMRDDRAAGGKLDGRKAWADCMAAAEAEIEKLIAHNQVAA